MVNFCTGPHVSKASYDHKTTRSSAAKRRKESRQMRSFWKNARMRSCVRTQADHSPQIFGIIMDVILFEKPDIFLLERSTLMDAFPAIRRRYVAHTANAP